MEGAISRSTQTTLLKRHLASFDKLLQYAISRYSTEKLLSKLTILVEALQRTSSQEDFPRAPGRHIYKPNISSLSDLRRSLKSIKKTASKYQARNTDRHIVHYFEAYFEDLQYLKELKRYFDEKIHRTLYENFYDPLIDSHGHGNNSHHANLLHSARVLYEICSKWDNVVNNEEYAQHSSFDSQSLPEIKSFIGKERFTIIARTIPDIFIKAFKASEFAKAWLNHSRWVFKDNTKPRTVSELTQKELQLKERVLSLTLEIAKIESDVESEYEELRVLRHKETRHLELDEKQRKVTKLKDDAHTKITALLEEKDRLSSQSESSLPPESFRDKRMDIDMRIMKAEGDMKTINFQLTLLEEDYHLEILLLPEIVMYISEVESNIESLESSLRRKQSVRQTTESNLSMLKKNLTKMKEVLGKYHRRSHSEISVETNEAGDTLSTGRSEATPSDFRTSPDGFRSEEDMGTGCDHDGQDFGGMVDRGTGITPGLLDDFSEDLTANQSAMD